MAGTPEITAPTDPAFGRATGRRRPGSLLLAADPYLGLLAGYQTPTVLGRLGKNQLAARLKNRKVCNSQPFAATASRA
jgi:hypothetical protein